MVVARKRIGKRARARFQAPRWNRESPEWLALDRELPADHLARQIVEVLRLLDLTPLWESYTAGGSTAYRPDLMVAIVLYEMRRNRISPGQGYADVHDSRALQFEDPIRSL